MKNLFQIVSFLFILYSGIVYSQESKIEAGIFLNNNKEEYVKIAFEIWNNPELGYLEFESSKKLQDLLAKEGFTIEKGVAGLPTAFIASYGKGSPIIGIMGEFDALPGLSQKAIPEKVPVVENGPGHGCGHHVFGVASAAAAISVKHWLEESGTPGTIKFFGTPAEEGGSGKVYMVRAGLFDELDIALHWHPADLNAANPWSTNANISAKFRFSGIASHAAGAPEKGRSALDGVEAMNYMVNMMREHLPQETRIHYVITGGGGIAPNVVPPKAEVYYYVRYSDASELMNIFQRVVKAAEGAAMGTGTEMEYEIMGGVHSVLPNVALSKILDANLREVGGVIYNEKENEYAEKIRASLLNPKTSMKAA
ncbi:MAG: amidohydrolase, partial [Bacteroidota bacterium]|nr:amidohydrolase [Bacteroidota bacterium]